MNKENGITKLIDGEIYYKFDYANFLYEELQKKDDEKDKYKNVIDKIKEIINNNAFFDPAMPNCMALGQKSTLEIKKLLEEVE